MVLKVAITGGIGTGKSTVGDILANEGLAVIDTDEIVHELLSIKCDWTDKIVSLFGREVVAGGSYFIDKKALAKIVFADQEKKKALESILHPLVRQAVKAFYDTEKDSKYAFVLIPLLFESKQEEFYDEIWCVKCNSDQQVERLKNKGFSTKDLQARIRSQIPLEEKISRSDFVIDNSKDAENTKTQVLERLKLTAT